MATDAGLESLEIDPIEQGLSLRKRVANTIQRAIVTRQLIPGTVLSVPVLALRFQVSGTPVREAMLDLERRGFVAPVRNKGFRITPASPERIRELTVIRVLLEPPVARMIAGTIAPDEIARLRENAQRVLDCVVDWDQAGRSDAEFEFHRRLTDLAGSPMLTDLVMDLRLQARVPDLGHLRDAGELRESADEHFRLVDLLEEGRGEEAEELLRIHISRVLDWFATPDIPD